MAMTKLKNIEQEDSKQLPMKKSLSTTIFGIILVLLIALTSCTPQATPTPSVTVAPSVQPTVSPPTSNLPSPASQEDAAFAKIVDAAKKEGKVTAYSFNWVGDTGLAVQKAFESKYGIKLDIITGRGAEFQARIMTERRIKQQVGDFTEGSTLLNQSMKIDGVLADVSADLPALKEKGVWLADPTTVDPQAKTNLIWRLIVFCPYVNTKEVKQADIPTSWKDFLDPKWSGKMSFTDPNIGPGTNQYMVVLMENGVWNEDYIKNLYKQKLVFPGSVPDEFNLLARGDRVLMVRGSDSDVGKFAVEGAPIQAIDVKEGVVYSTGSMAAIAGGPNPNATRVLMNWILTKEGQIVTGKAQNMQMLRNDVPDFRPKAAQIKFTKTFVESIDNVNKATQMFRDKWFDKLVGR